MPLPTIPDVFRCAVEWETSEPSHAVNVLHVEAPGKTPADVFAQIDAGWTQDMIHLQSARGIVRRFAITPLDGSSAASIFPTDGSSRYIGDSGGQYIPQAAQLIKMTTGLGGPRHRGRLFLPYVSEDAQDAGVLGDASVALVTGAWEDFANSLLPDYALVVASYTHSDANQVTNIACEKLLGTQKRRMDRVRRA
jgi:hypothetical protein